jgi:hypothetical protein
VDAGVEVGLVASIPLVAASQEQIAAEPQRRIHGRVLSEHGQLVRRERGAGADVESEARLLLHVCAGQGGEGGDGEEEEEEEEEENWSSASVYSGHGVMAFNCIFIYCI